MYTYRVWGIRRSGNHAVIGWILKHVGAPFIHFNDIQDPEDPLTPGGVRVSGIPAWRYKRGLLRKIRHYFPARHQASFAGADPSVDYGGLAALPWLSCRVFSYEDKPVMNAGPVWDIALPGETPKTVLLLRDPFNLVASLLKADCFSRRLDELPALYASHADEFLRQAQTGLIGINYNDWFRDATYRISVARRLGFATDGSPYDEVPANGGGSSFSGQAYRGRASRMDVSGRWRQVVGHTHFQRLVEAPQVRAAAEAIFPALAREVYSTLRAERGAFRKA